MFLSYLCTALLLLTGFLLMFIVLLQRGRGGGLAGAFGGLGGQSAFGTKAGDVFTKITIILAVIWVSLAGVTGFAMRYDSEKNSFKSGKKLDGPELTNPDGTTPPKPGKKQPQKKKSPAKTDDGQETPVKTDGKTDAGGSKPDPKATTGPSKKKPANNDDLGPDGKKPKSKP